MGPICSQTAVCLSASTACLNLLKVLYRMNLNDVLLELAGSTFDENATVEQALKKLSLPDSHTRLSGMSSVLLPHQILGVAWMREREAHTYVIYRKLHLVPPHM